MILSRTHTRNCTETGILKYLSYFVCGCFSRTPPHRFCAWIRFFSSYLSDDRKRDRKNTINTMQQRDSWRGKKADPLIPFIRFDQFDSFCLSALISFLIICTKQLWNWLRMLNMKKEWFLAQKRKKTYSIYVKPMNWLIFCNVEQELAHQFVNQRKYVCSFDSSHLFFYTSISLSLLSLSLSIPWFQPNSDSNN